MKLFKPIKYETIIKNKKLDEFGDQDGEEE